MELQKISKGSRSASIYADQVLSLIGFACSTEPMGVGDIGSILRKIGKTVSEAWPKRRSKTSPNDETYRMCETSA